jgi:hypothetical protein
MGPSILDMFGVKVPDYMMGKPIFGGSRNEQAAALESEAAASGEDSDKQRAREDG